MTNDNLKSLHKTLQNSGYNPPSYEEFENDMKDENNLHGVWETLKSEGYTPPEFDVFKQDMGFVENVSEQKEGGSNGIAGQETKAPYKTLFDMQAPENRVDENGVSGKAKAMQETLNPWGVPGQQQPKTQKEVSQNLMQAQAGAEQARQTIFTPKENGVPNWFTDVAPRMKEAEVAERERQAAREDYDAQNFEGFYQSGVKPVFEEEKRGAEERYKQIAGKNDEFLRTAMNAGDDPSLALSAAVKSAIDYERVTDPEKVTRNVIEKSDLSGYALGRMGFDANGAETDGESAPMSEQEKKLFNALYGKEIGEVSEKVQQRMYQDYIDAGVPKSDANYILGKAFHDNMVANLGKALIARVAGTKNLREQFRAQAYQKYGEEAGWLTKAAGAIAPLAVDVATGGFAVPSLAGKGAAEGVTSLLTKKLANKAAERVGTEAATRAATRYMVTNSPLTNLAIRSIGSAVNFGTFETQGAIIQQLGEGKFDPAAIGKAFLHGAALGSVMGAAGGAIGEATKGLSLAGKAAGYAGEVAAETGIFAADKAIEKAMQDGVGILDVDWASITGESLGMVAGFKLMGLGELRQRFAKSPDYDLKLNSRDVKDLESAGYDFRNIFKGMDEVGKMMPLTKKVEIGDYEPNKSKIRGEENKEIEVDSDELLKMLRDPDISADTKRKLFYLVTGKVVAPESVFNSEMEINEDGTATVFNYNIEGKIAGIKEFDDVREADAYQRQSQAEAKDNAISIALNTFGLAEDVEAHAKKMTNEKYNINIDEILQKKSEDRTDEEKAFIKDYVKTWEDLSMNVLRSVKLQSDVESSVQEGEQLLESNMKLIGDGREPVGLHEAVLDEADAAERLMQTPDGERVKNLIDTMVLDGESNGELSRYLDGTDEATRAAANDYIQAKAKNKGVDIQTEEKVKGEVEAEQERMSQFVYQNRTPSGRPTLIPVEYQGRKGYVVLENEEEAMVKFEDNGEEKPIKKNDPDYQEASPVALDDYMEEYASQVNRETRGAVESARVNNPRTKLEPVVNETIDTPQGQKRVASVTNGKIYLEDPLEELDEESGQMVPKHKGTYEPEDIVTMEQFVGMQNEVYDAQDKAAREAEKKAVTPGEGGNADMNASAQNEENPAAEPQGTEAQQMPMMQVKDKKTGKTYEEPDFYKAGAQRSYDYLYNEAGLDRSEANGVVKAGLAQAKAEEKKVEDRKPKIEKYGTSIGRYKQDKEAWENELKAAKENTKLWLDMQMMAQQEAMKAASTGSATMPEGMQMAAPETAAASQEKPKPKKNLEFDEPTSLRDWVMQTLLGGRYKFNWKDEGATKGLGKHLGERKIGSYKGWIDSKENGGMSPEKVAEKMLEDYASYMGWQGSDGDWQITSQDMFNEIMDVIHSYPTKDLLREAIAKLQGKALTRVNNKLVEAEVNPEEEAWENEQKDLWAQDAGFNSYEEYESYVEMINDSREPMSPEEYERKKAADAEIYEELSVPLQQNEQSINTEENGEENLHGTGTGVQGGSEVLPEQGSGEASGSEGVDGGQGEVGSTPQQGAGSVSQGEGAGQSITYQVGDTFDIIDDYGDRKKAKVVAVNGDDITVDVETWGTVTFTQDQLNENRERLGAGQETVQGKTSSPEEIEAEEKVVNTEPTEGQKKAGNYKMGHIKVDGFDVTIENPKGSVRRGTDADGRAWEQEMHNTYGYIRGTEGVDGDHIDVFLSDDPTQGDVFVVDQVNKDGSFDEHKVMYGFPDMESARQAYLSNYEEGWQGLGAITPVSKEEFKKWVESSHRKTKPFAEYSSVKTLGDVHDELIYTSENITPEQQALLDGNNPRQYPAEREQSEGKGTEVSDNKQKKGEKSSKKIQGLEGYDPDEVLFGIRGDVEQALEEAGLDEDVIIKDMAIIGSRMRGDAREDSDLDVVLEYEGDISEDALFNILNETPIEIEGIKVDINPITKGKSGTLEEYMKRSAAYDEEKRNANMNASAQNEDGSNGIAGQETKQVEPAAVDFEKETMEEWQAFEKRVPKMSDEELLGYMEAQGDDETNAYHSSVYDEYDARHRDEYLERVGVYKEELDKMFESVEEGEDEVLERVEGMQDSAQQQWEDGGYCKPERTALLAQMDAINEWIDEFLNREKEPLEEYNPVRRAEQVIEREKTDAAAKKIQNESLLKSDVDDERAKKLRQDLADAYASNDPAVIKKAIDAVNAYRDEGKDFPQSYSEEVDDYEGDNPMMLADKYIIHTYQDRYLDDDEDQEYIKTGLTRKMRGEEGAGMVSEPRRKPKAVSLLQGELFKDEDFEEGSNGIAGQETKKNAEGEPQRTEQPDLTQIGLRPLEEGETSHVERRYVENGFFDFTGSEKIESMDDVAYIFRQLQNASVENAFMVLVKDGVPTVIHMGMGGYMGTSVDGRTAYVAYHALNPDKVYMVHNHPSGKLVCSREDRELYINLGKLFGDKLQPGIIIDTTSGRYGVFDEVGDMYDVPLRMLIENGAKSYDDVKPLKVYSFSKSVFAPDWNPDSAWKMVGSDDVAKFVSAHRLGEHEKMSLLVLNNNRNVTGNVFLPWTTMKEANTKEGAELIAYYMNQMGGTDVILYGNTRDNGDKKNALELKKKLESKKVRVVDVVRVAENPADYESMAEKGLMEPAAGYEAKRETQEDKLYNAYRNEQATVEKQGGLVRNGLSERILSRNWRGALHALGRRIGRRIIIISGEDARRLYGDVRAFYDSRDNSIYLNEDYVKDNENVRNFLIGHEFTHILRRENPEVWKAFVDTVKELMGEDFTKEFNAIRKRYDDFVKRYNATHAVKWDRYTDAQIEEEVCANWAGRNVLTDEAAVKKIIENAEQAGADPVSLTQKILNYIKRWIAELKDMLRATGGNKSEVKRNLNLAEKAKQLWQDMYNVAVARQNAKMEKAEAEESSVRFSLVHDPFEVARLESEPKETGYRNVVQNEDGTLGSPMADKLGKKGEKSKRTSAFELGRWEKSDEHPEMATDDGKIDLVKPDNKKVGGVDYNPYIHIRPDKVNKQFKQAWERPNLVYVETLYPTSELTSGYQAEKAKKTVGEHDWNGGKLILSRWDKPVRIVPWEEVADDWMKEFENNPIHFDIVPPALLPILAERGANIVAPHKGMGEECVKAYEEWLAAKPQGTGTSLDKFRARDKEVELKNLKGDGLHRENEFYLGGKLSKFFLGIPKDSPLRYSTVDIVSSDGKEISASHDSYGNIEVKVPESMLKGKGDVKVLNLADIRDAVAGEIEKMGENEVMFSLGEVDNDFNNQLDKLNEKNMDSIIMSLGNPSQILLDAGVEDKPMKLYGNKIIAKQKKHGFKLEELKNLPSSVADPIAVFNNHQKEGDRSILTELRTKDGNFLVSVDLGKKGDVDFNIISSVFGKEDWKIGEWFKKGFATYINEEKVKDFLLHNSAPIAAASAKSSPNSGAKINGLSELNKLFGEKLYVRTKNFKNWFGDWEKNPEHSSKVVDENGEPLVVYKRMREDVNEFDTSHGVFFSDEPINDESFGDKVNQYYLNFRKPLDVDAGGEYWSYPLWRYASDKEGSFPETKEEFDKVVEERKLTDMLPKEVWDVVFDSRVEYDWEDLGNIVKQYGLDYDGIIIRNIREGNQGQHKLTDFIAMEPNQIKSATDNNGEFSTENNDVRFSLPEEVERDKEYAAAVEAGDMVEAQKMVEEAAKAAGYTIRAYHGTGRADRVGNVFRPERATSGPMAFFTDNREIAESYAKGKQDTSLRYDSEYDSYETQFRTKHKATGKDFALWDLWGFLPFEERRKIAEKAGHVREDWDGDGKPIYDPNTTNASGGFEWQVKERRGNILRALTDQWLLSGNLYRNEKDYLKVLELAGVTEALERAGFEAPRYMDPDYREEKVYDAYLKIQNPFDATEQVNEDFIQGFEEFAEEHEGEYVNETADADLWDKNNIDADEFAERMRYDIEKGWTHAWTSIPDVMTAYLKSLGYDGIKDKGGKNGGEVHTVWIPFSSEQVKSADAVTYDDKGNVIPLSERMNSEENDIRFSLPEEDDWKPVFYSNAEKAVRDIKQEKATPEQWLKMIEKNGGLKAGEDKWLNLSDWLKERKEKSLTKQEVLDYIKKNQIEVVEADYASGGDWETNPKMVELRDEFDRIAEVKNAEMKVLDKEAEVFDEQMSEKYGEGWKYKLEGEDKKKDAEIEQRYAEIGYPYHAAYREMVEKYGDDFEQAFEVNGGSLDPVFDYYGDDISDATRYFLDIWEAPIHETRLHYTTDGLTNKREIALVVPSIEPWNESDTIHFGDAGGGRAVAWVRFGDAKMPVREKVYKSAELQEPVENSRGNLLYYPKGMKPFWSKDYIVRFKDKDGNDKYSVIINEAGFGVFDTLEEAQDNMNFVYQNHPKEKVTGVQKVLVIDEIQSKRHQTGREKGYVSKEYEQEHEKLIVEQERTEEAKRKFEWDMANKYNLPTNMDYMEEDQISQRLRKHMSEEEKNEYERLQEAAEQASMELSKFELANREKRNAVPDAPFDKNWHELAMKRMLRYAAENGYDKVAWTKGAQQAERYNLGNVVDHIEATEWEDYSAVYDDQVGECKNVLIYDRDGNQLYDLIVNREGQVISGAGADVDSLPELVGKDLAVRLMAEGEQNIEGEDLLIGAEGMKGFYDQMLPRFMDKYGKKWGVKTGEVELPDLNEKTSEKFWAVDVTPEMKESVMQGQPMFSLPEEPLSEYDPVKRAEQVVNRDTMQKIIDFFKGAKDEAVKLWNDGQYKLAGRLFKDVYGVDNLVVTDGSTVEELIKKGLRKKDAKEIVEIKKQGDKNKFAAQYYPMSDKIIIFANGNKSLAEIRSELMHESIHQYLRRIPNRYPVLKEFWETYSEKQKGLVDAITDEENGYAEEDWKEEFFTYMLEAVLSRNTKIAFKKASDIIHKTIEGYLNTINYGNANLLKEIFGGSSIVNRRRFIKEERETLERIRGGRGNQGGQSMEVRDTQGLSAGEGRAQENGNGLSQEELQSGVLRGGRRDSDSGVMFSLPEEEGEKLDVTKPEYSLRTAQISLDYAAKHKDDLNARIEAMKEIGGNLSQLRRAMSLQREYDRKTVDKIVKLARMVMDSGFIDELSRGEVKKLLGLVNGAAGKEDISMSAKKVIDMLVGHQLRELENALLQQLRVRGSKLTGKGVEVQGKLDIEGQRMVKALKDGMKMDEEGLNELMADALDRMGSEDPVTANNATVEYQGLLLAKQYLEEIRSKELEATKLRMQLRKTKEEARASEGDYGRFTTRDSYLEYLNSVDEALSENQFERIEAYMRLLDAIGGRLAESIEGAKEWREQEAERVAAIQHDANSDLEGKPAHTQQKLTWLDKAKNLGIVRWFMQPLATFDEMLRFIGEKSVDGRGYLWNRYMNGWANAQENYWRGIKEAHDELDAKVKELFSEGTYTNDKGKTVKLPKIERWSDLFSLVRKMPGAEVSFWDDGEKTYNLSAGNLLYIYMVDKMTDGRMKLRRMGITEEDVQDIKEALDPRFVQLADWMQEEYLVKKREKYNAVYERMFGAPMAAIEHYFPLNIDKKALNKTEDISAYDGREDINPATITGSVIKRKTNVASLDLINSDAFDLMLKHLEDMEKWAAFAEFNRDLNTLLSYKKFRNRLSNMKSLRYGAGDKVLENFKTVAAIAGGAYRPHIRKDSIDAWTVNLAKGVTAAKISLRFYTALKQLLSYPAYLSEANLLELVKSSNPAGAVKSWNWAMENLPLFAERWQSRKAGDYRLEDTDLDWAVWHKDMVRWAARIGMSPNAFVDGLTVAMGAKAVYETAKKRYLKDGFDSETAEKKALLDAAVAYNETQQSSQSAFMSAMQLDRTFASVALTVFRNASMAYERRMVRALANMKKRMNPKYKDSSQQFMQKMLEREGMGEEEAKKASERMYRRQQWRDAVDVAVFGYILQAAWNLAPYLPYLLFGDDDDKKKEMLEDALIHAAFGGVEGMPAGNLMSDFFNTGIQIAKETDKSKLNRLKRQAEYKDFNLLPLMSDLQDVLEHALVGSKSAIVEGVNLLLQSGVGVNPQTFSDAVVATIDAFNGDMGFWKEFAFGAARVLQTPQTSMDMLYIDELGMFAHDARRLSLESMAKRWARYKMRKENPLTMWVYTDEEKKDLEDKYIKRFEQKVQERIESMDEGELMETFDWTDDATERKMLGKQIAKDEGSEDVYGNKPSSKWKKETQDAYVDYQRCRDAEDVKEDALLTKAVREADGDRKAALKNAREALNNMKKGLGKGDEAAVMKGIRETRKQIMKDFGIEQ